ncbi:MAG: type II toxin-antitoxin system RelE/ParE family toxin [bacterium]|nr:type II toxin-antitoxin system RelE/ParE family toxin [bacterium]
MDFRVVWSPEASDDLESIAEYIAKDSDAYARAVVTKILHVTRNIKKFPFIGRVVPEISNDNIRERFVYSYRVVYKIKEDTIIIVAIIHGKRLLENMPDRYER